MKRALVCGAGGFIGMHLVKKLRDVGYWVRGVDIKHHEWSPDGGGRVHAARSRESKPTAGQALTRRRRHFRRGLSARRRHGRHGVHPLGRNRDHAQQRADQHLHDRPGRPAGRAALLLLLVGLRLPRHAAGRAGDDGGRSRSRPIPTTSTAGRSSTPSASPMAYERRYGMQVRIARFQNCYGPEGDLDRAGARRRPPRCAARSPRPRTAARSRSGATARRCVPTPTSATWSTASTLLMQLGPARRGEHRLPAVRDGGRTGADASPRWPARRSTSGTSTARWACSRAIFSNAPHLLARAGQQGSDLDDGHRRSPIPGSSRRSGLHRWANAGMPSSLQGNLAVA
ncbi:MAG: hypothetical protein MZV70_65865 [Desulfobacterales bacterium]|nr:hypothetical protein [Desulfobacterales bacterium]